MKTKQLIKKISAALTAGALGLTISFAPLPAPAADASILGAVISGGIQIAQLNQEISYYNNNEEGRQKLFSELQQKYGVNEDADLNGRLDTIMGNLSGAIASVDPSINDKPYNYFVNNDTSFNAFCTLGHNMSVNTGLFNLLTNEDEIAVVLGHEMGHGQKDHPAKGMRKSMPYELIAQIYAESQGGSLGGNVVATIFANQATATQVTKPQEWEADNLAFDYITHSNYNPGACAAVWQRVIEKQGSGSSDNFIGEIFSPNDHPSNEQRRENYEKKLYEYSGKHVNVKEGKVQVNGKDFTTPAAAGDMSGAERSYFVAGNLAAAYHNGHASEDAYVGDNGTVMFGAQAIMTPAAGDASSSELAAQLNKIK